MAGVAKRGGKTAATTASSKATVVATSAAAVETSALSLCYGLLRCLPPITLLKPTVHGAGLVKLRTRVELDSTVQSSSQF